MASRKEKRQNDELKEVAREFGAGNCWGKLDNDPVSQEIRRRAVLDAPDPFSSLKTGRRQKSTIKK